MLNFDHVDKWDEDLIYFSKAIRSRLRHEWDVVISITGEEGSGKSTFGMVFGYLVDKFFDLIKNVSYLPNANEIKEEFTRLKRYQYYMIDEAIRSLYKLNFMSNLQQSLIQMWATERNQNKCTVLILPRFKDLTENFRNHRVKFWIHLEARGKGVCYIRDDDPHSLDPWGFDEAIKLKQKMLGKKNVATISVDQRIKIARKLRNYLFDFEFPPLSPQDEITYKQLKHESRLRFWDDEKRRKETKKGKLFQKYKDDRNKLIYQLIDRNPEKHQKTKTMELIQETLGISMPEIKKILKERRNTEKRKKESKDDFERYTGVDVMLDKALEFEKQKQNNV